MDCVHHGYSGDGYRAGALEDELANACARKQSGGM